MLDNVVSPITCVSMNHQNQFEQMANGAMFATRHQLYAALSGLTSKEEKKRQRRSLGFLCSSNKEITRYLHQVPNPKLST
jgi:hypothetical protein